MKTLFRSLLMFSGVLLAALSCSEPDLPMANPYNSGATFKAYFSFANATVDAPSLDFYINGVKIGSGDPGIGSAAATSVQIPTAGIAGGVTANTSIRAKATTGTIGGKLKSNDLIYRSANNGTNNFAAVNLANYTVIALDSIDRPIPLRLNRVALTSTPGGGTTKISFADVTYWNPNTLSMISASKRDSLNPANCPACYNWDDVGLVQNPSTATEFANLVQYGSNTPPTPVAIPLGLTDPGGVRFYVVQDVPLTFNAGNVTTNAGIRFVNAVANSNGVAAAANTNGSFGGPALYARLKPVAGANITLASNSNCVVSFAGGFGPNAGSRTSGTLAFTSQAIATAGTPIDYTLEVAFDAAYTNIAYSAPVSFAPGKNYTVFVRGKFSSLTGTQPNLGHGIITH